MMPPLICTSNSQGHVDYGIPLLASKSTDYRTCTGTYHRFIPSFPQHFDCRVKANIKPELIDKDIALREDVKSSYTNDYGIKFNQNDQTEKYERATNATRVNYMRNVQEKIFMNPPPPFMEKLSEMKDAYRLKHYTATVREVIPPALSTTCEIQGLERPLQPAVPPEEKGYWKYMDIYMTQNKLDYPPYSHDQKEQSATDIVTVYSGTGKYKTLKKELPGPLTGNKSVYDKRTFKSQYPNKLLSRGQKHCPHLGLQSEYQGNYKLQTFSDLYPYLSDTGIVFEDSLADAGPWQNLCSPGMYCTEQCHIGTGWPVRAVVDVGPEKENVVHEPCTLQIKG